MSNSSLAEMYFMGAMMILILLICAVACFFFFRQLKREKLAAKKSKENLTGKENQKKNMSQSESLHGNAPVGGN